MFIRKIRLLTHNGIGLQIRTIGTWKKKHLQGLQEQLNGKKTEKKESKVLDKELKHLKCPRCKEGTLHVILMFSKTRPPPDAILKIIATQNKKNVNKIQSSD